MSLFYLVKQDYGVGVAAHFFSELSALLIAYVSGRRSDEAGDGELLHVFAHVDADQSVGRIKHVFREFLGQVGLAYTGRAEEEEGADRLVGVFQTDAVALDGFDHLFDSRILSDDAAFESGSHLFETLAFGLGYALDGHTGHHGYHFGHFLGIDGLAHRIELFLPAGFRFFEGGFELLLLVAV